MENFNHDEELYIDNANSIELPEEESEPKVNIKYDKEIVRIFRHEIAEFGWEVMKQKIEDITDPYFRYEMRLHLYKANE